MGHHVSEIVGFQALASDFRLMGMQKISFIDSFEVLQMPVNCPLSDYEDYTEYPTLQTRQKGTKMKSNHQLTSYSDGEN